MAKVVGVNVGSNTKYDIQQIKMFKGPDRVIHAIFTASSPAACGVTLETNKEYLFIDHPLHFPPLSDQHPRGVPVDGLGD
ncbi:metalloproteinase inhibitor 2 isoform X2 [Coregonus clupeaformis]|nr:metalloproteinase inhibitor 2 isoform X2 [Coregonus clupeaformis]XP_045075778.1 metalloproteinase inhibitor 2 isoform X2 [Coregonus clupeaformis]